MEVACNKKLIERNKDNTKITCYCHDKDAKLTNLVADMRWHVQEFLDTNHALKSFDRQWNNLQVAQRRHLQGLKNRLRSYMRHLLYLEEDMPNKVNYWKNSVNHYIGNHEECEKHGDVTYSWHNKGNRDAITSLTKFLENTTFIIRDCKRGLSTQLNESYHSLKSKFADKDHCWITSWKARISCAVLQWNEGETWKLRFYESLGLPPLPEPCIVRFWQRVEER